MNPPNCNDRIKINIPEALIVADYKDGCFDLRLLDGTILKYFPLDDFVNFVENLGPCKYSEWQERMAKA